MLSKTVIVLAVFLLSCASQNQEYLSRRTNQLKKYAMFGHITMQTDSRLNMADLKIRKQFRKTMDIIESYVALSPDSVSNNTSGSLDSFYVNVYKIKYINKHSLITAGRHCSE